MPCIPTFFTMSNSIALITSALGLDAVAGATTQATTTVI